VAQERGKTKINHKKKVAQSRFTEKEKKSAGPIVLYEREKRRGKRKNDRNGRRNGDASPRILSLSTQARPLIISQGRSSDEQRP
jgi:hypothetical protein